MPTPTLEELALGIVRQIESFDAECSAGEGTDTDAAWGLFYTIRDSLRKALNLPAAGNKDVPLYQDSPEVTERWECTACRNTTHFQGIDDHGYGGPEECECGAREKDGICECETALTQDFRVDPETKEVHYSAFTGGGFDAEIGSYTRIYCNRCSQLLWQEPEAESSLGSDQSCTVDDED